MRTCLLTESEEALAHLVHDLRQPLGTLEYSACYLQLLLGDAHEAVKEQLRIMQHQLDLASRLLTEAAGRAAHAQDAETVESFDLTKSATAAVT